jgi:predicted amidophosphoribosyltransferase
MTTDTTATCAGCGEEYEHDGETAGALGGRFLCEDCTRKPVVFEAECLDCEWAHRVEGHEAELYAARQRAQQEGNSHESSMQLTEDESHETVWRRVDPDAGSDDRRTETVYLCGGCERVYGRPRTAVNHPEEHCPHCGTPTASDQTEVSVVAF